MKTKGFIGLGVMGFPMAGHISKAYPTQVYNRTLSKAKDWVDLYSGTIALSPEEMGNACEEIFMCIGNDDDVREVVSGEKGLLKSLKSGSIIVDHTTTSAKLSREMSDFCSEKGVHYIDAPVSGGQAGADNGSLTIMAGGREDPFNIACETMSCYSKFYKLMGPSGSGQLTKMVNQICIAGLVQGLSEAMAFGKKANLDMEKVLQVISKGAAQSWQMENRYKTMLKGEYEFGFAVDWMRKDLSICFNEAEKNGASLPVTKIVDKYYEEVQNNGGSRYDTSSLMTLVDDK